MKLISLTLKNFKGIKSFTLEAQGGNVDVFGVDKPEMVEQVDAGNFGRCVGDGGSLWRGDCLAFCVVVERICLIWKYLHKTRITNKTG